MLHTIYALSLVEFALDVAEDFAEAGGADFVDEPDIFIILNLV